MSSRVLLLCGGTWDEREISLESAGQVLPALREGGLGVTPVRWDEGGWAILGEKEDDLLADAVTRSPLVVVEEARERGIGIVFNCLHGGPGEDGTVQGFLEIAGVPYTGAGVRGSAISGDKHSFRVAVAALGAEVSPGFVLERGMWQASPSRVLEIVSVDVGLPVIVKPLASGSSFGVTKCDTPEAVETALEAATALESRTLIERFVPGRELSIPCLGTRFGEPPDVLPMIEIEPLTDTGFFDLEAKYEKGRAHEIIPAPIEKGLARHLAELAVRIHHDLDLGGVSRTDLILGPDGPVFLETQTVPGITAGSLLPKSAAAAGLDLTALCRRLLDYAVSVHLARGVGAATPRS